MIQGSLYLLPNLLGESPVNSVLPANYTSIINQIGEFIVEDLKSARRLLKQAGYIKDLSETTFHLLNKHTNASEFNSFLSAIEKGINIGIISEAGCPAVADPGSSIVAIAHEKNIKVIPVTGPSSILLSLMASGMNGQSFCFHGYLPKEKEKRAASLKKISNTASNQDQTQLFIETPFRNNHMLDDILSYCPPSLRLCIAVNLTTPNEYIKTTTIAEWKKQKPDLNKKPAIFIIGR